MLRETFATGALGCNCTILGCPTTKEAVVIDPGGSVGRIASIVKANGLTVKAIIHTHAHLDHIHKTRDVKEAHGGTICLHEEDLFLYDGIAVQAEMLGWKVRPVLPVDRFVDDGDVIQFGERSAEVIHTPGHTPGSICFEVTPPGEVPLLFAGDTLFKRSVGRTDLPGGSNSQLRRSITQRLYTRNLDTVVIPGHGPVTTLGDEARSNPFVRA